jgi:hypothetical protein
VNVLDVEKIEGSQGAKGCQREAIASAMDTGEGATPGEQGNCDDKPRLLFGWPDLAAACRAMENIFGRTRWTEAERNSRDELPRRIAENEGLIRLPTETLNEEPSTNALNRKLMAKMGR